MDQRLTRREVQCLRFAGDGLTNKEIARRLGQGTSPKTVSNHLSHAYQKVGTSDRLKAAAIAASAYPDYSRFGPIPIDSAALVAAPLRLPDTSDEGSETSKTAPWPLPAPSRGVLVRLGIVAIFASLAAIVVIGVVAVMWASVSLTAPFTPWRPAGSNHDQRDSR